MVHMILPKHHIPLLSKHHYKTATATTKLQLANVEISPSFCELTKVLGLPAYQLLFNFVREIWILSGLKILAIETFSVKSIYK